MLRATLMCPDNLALTFSSRLSEIVATRGIKKKDLAEEMGINPTSLSRYLSGKSLPNSYELDKLATILQVSLDWLFGKQNNASVEQWKQRALADEEFIRTTIARLHEFVDSVDDWPPLSTIDTQDSSTTQSIAFEQVAEDSRNYDPNASPDKKKT